MVDNRLATQRALGEISVKRTEITGLLHLDTETGRLELSDLQNSNQAISKQDTLKIAAAVIERAEAALGGTAVDVPDEIKTLRGLDITGLNQGSKLSSEQKIALGHIFETISGAISSHNIQTFTKRPLPETSLPGTDYASAISQLYTKHFGSMPPSIVVRCMTASLVGDTFVELGELIAKHKGDSNLKPGADLYDLDLPFVYERLQRTDGTGPSLVARHVLQKGKPTPPLSFEPDHDPERSAELQRLVEEYFEKEYHLQDPNDEPKE